MTNGYSRELIMLSHKLINPFLHGRHLYGPATRLSRGLRSSSIRRRAETDPLNKEYDAIVIGAGHNGLVAAAYLQKSGLNTLVLERRHLIGGAAVTEEIVPGFKFSRCSYVLSLLRPAIIRDLELEKHGLKVHMRNEHAFTPLLEEPGPGGKPRSLLMSRDEEFTRQQIAQFSQKDAQMYYEFDEYLNRIAAAIGPMMDNPPIDLNPDSRQTMRQKMHMLDTVKSIAQSGRTLGRDIPAFYELLTAPMNKILNRWFESEPLKATLATDSVIGAFLTPDTPGSGYVLLHHVMGEVNGVKGAWGYVEGGMGAVSGSIASAARSYGTTILTEKPVSSVLASSDQEACGVVLADGTEIKSKVVLSNATPKVTFLDLLPSGLLPEEMVKEVSSFDFKSPVTKINVALDRLPNFTAMPNKRDNTPGPNHSGTIHLNCETTGLLNEAYEAGVRGELPEKPMVEMCIPSALDPTLAPAGCHVVSLFTQYTPYDLSDGRKWDDQTKDMYCDRVFDCIEAYAPGFKDSVVGRDILPPPELERIFGLTGGNIFHGAMSLDQLYFARPSPSCGSYRTPLKGLYLCGSGAHPGGGVMGAPGKNAALVVKADMT